MYRPSKVRRKLGTALGGLESTGGGHFSPKGPPPLQIHHAANLFPSTRPTLPFCQKCAKISSCEQ